MTTETWHLVKRQRMVPVTVALDFTAERGAVARLREHRTSAFSRHIIIIIITLLFFNWRIIASHYCFHFCCTAKWISYMCTYVSSLLNLPPHSTPLGHHRVLWWAPCAIYQLPLALCFTYGSVYMSVLLSQFTPPSSCPFCVHMSVFYVCISIPTNSPDTFFESYP